MQVRVSPFPFSLQEKQTKEALTRKQQKCRRKNQDEESQEAPELLKRPKEYTVRFTFPNPPPLSPPVLGLHGEPLSPVARVGARHPSSRAGTQGPEGDGKEKLRPLLALRCDLWLRGAETAL